MTKSIAVLVGSLRKGAINLSLAHALEKLAEGKLKFHYVELGDLPLYNEDLWANPPAAVLRMKKEVSEADGILMLTPEYNRSYAGVLKNAMDWGSRPYGQSCWKNKPTAVTGASPGAIGAAVGQARLRNDLASLSTILMPGPEAYIQWKPEAYGADGSVTDENTRAFLQSFVDHFASFVEKLS
ncbi:NADPH-dependent FMN reductase [Paracoccus aminophilus]|uniref:NADPH-dependent FMN reductase n=1 Tax=Paracoccus aminophilus JCM 7686 TaxID=1367847 RepID=S5YVM0_PARAH|nr:NAD(P)H-dependent oxidoreductase [Paracoccus aminophilus]AGT09281.1 NADPH-dependent FMN reductase [Paracoccus aminophilus JCM 7686]